MDSNLRPVWNATVVGYGKFPTDMLTWDNCVPRTVHDENAIARSHEDGLDAFTAAVAHELAEARVEIEHVRGKRYVVNVQGKGNDGPAWGLWKANGYTFTYLDFTTTDR